MVRGRVKAGSNIDHHIARIAVNLLRLLAGIRSVKFRCYDRYVVTDDRNIPMLRETIFTIEIGKALTI